MAKLTLKKAATDVTVYLFAQDSSKTTGEGLTGLAYNTASLTAYYVRPLGSATAITLATQTVTGAHSDGGFKEVDATNMPGVYRLDLPDAVCATGVPSVVVMLKGAANLAPVLLEIQLTDFDLNTAGVLIGATQGAITWGQQKIVANVAGEGALDIENTSTDGGGVGIRAEGEFAGQYNAGSQTRTSAGQYNTGVQAVWNNGVSIGQYNIGSYKAVDGFDSALALEDTLTAIKGSGWTNQTLVKIVTDISNISAGSGATPQQIWEYATRELTAGTNITIPTAADVADAVWDEAISGHTTATTFGGKNQKVVPSETVGDYKADVSSLATAASLTTVDNKVGTIDGIVDAIKLKTDTIPASPAEAGEYTAAIAAVKSVADDILVDTSTTLDGKLNTIDTNVDSILADTGTDGVVVASGQTVATVTNLTNLPTMPADWVTASGLKADAVTEIQSGLALEATLTAIKEKTDNLPADPADDSDIDAQLAAIKAETAAILVDTGTTLDTKINTIDGIVDDILVDTGTTIPATLTTIDNFIDTEVAAILEDTNEIQAELADGGRTDLLIDAIKAKSDLIPASPAEAGEYTTVIAALQTDLDNPDQYKADVSGLATANEYDTDFTQVVELLYSIMGGEGWTDETLVSIQAVIEAVKAKSDQLTFTTANKVDASATIDPTGLATSADLAVVDENIDEIKAKTDQMAFTVPNKIDASATVDPTGIATSEELEIIGEKVDDVLDKLNVSSVEFVTAVVGSTITILRGDTLTASLLNLGSMASYVSLDFTVKASTHQSDDAALIRVRKNASGLTDGLLRLNGAAHTTGTDGSITINDAPTGDITIMLKAGVTDDLVPGTYVYDIQLIEANEVSTLTTGTLIVSADVTRLVA